MIRFFLFLSLSLTAFADPFRIVIIADQGAVSRAGVFQNYIMTQPPFNRMRAEDLRITIRTLSATEAPRMNCLSPNPENDVSRRLVTCDQRELQRIQAAENASMAVAITSTPDYYGGSGGQVPVGTINLPDQILMHEMLHTTGLADEYPYTSAEEIADHCGRRRLSRVNAAFFQDVPPYASDAAARTRHTDDVPWMPRILPSTPITQLPSLETPDSAIVPGRQTIGLYRGGNCPPRDGKTSWRPYKNSLMNGHVDYTIYPIYEDAIISYMRTRMNGAPLVLTNTPEIRQRRALSEVEIQSATGSESGSSSGSETSEQ